MGDPCCHKKCLQQSLSDCFKDEEALQTFIEFIVAILWMMARLFDIVLMNSCLKCLKTSRLKKDFCYFKYFNFSLFQCQSYPYQNIVRGPPPNIRIRICI